MNINDIKGSEPWKLYNCMKVTIVFPMCVRHLQVEGNLDIPYIISTVC